MSDSKSTKNAFSSGCVSGGLSTLVLQPLDVIKTRLQAETIAGRRNPGILSVMRLVFNSKPIFSTVHLPASVEPYRCVANFWVGTVPSLYRAVPGVGGYFLCLTFLENLASRYTQTSLIRKFVIGFTARTVVGTILNPFYVVKTQRESGRRLNYSLWQTLAAIYRQAGFLGLYSGVVSTAIRDGPYAGLYFTIYTFFKNTVTRYHTIYSTGSDLPLYSLTICAALSALISTSITHPSDVVRAHRQLLLSSSISAPRNHRTTWPRILLAIHCTNGLTGLWRGMSLRLVRRTGSSAIAWTLYEYFS